MKYSSNGDTRYVDVNAITNKSWGTFISNEEMPIADALSLRPFNIDARLNKQLALRLSVPKDATPGRDSRGRHDRSEPRPFVPQGADGRRAA